MPWGGGGRVMALLKTTFANAALLLLLGGGGGGGGKALPLTLVNADVGLPPDVPAVSVTTDEDVAITVDLLASASDPDGDALSITTLSSVVGGTVIDNGDGSITFDPAENFFGDVEILFTVEDGVNTTIGTLLITVNPVNDAPVAMNDAAVTTENTAVDVDVLANDIDVDDDPLSITQVSSGDGSVTNNGDGTITFTPAQNFNGQAEIDYTVEDGNGGSANGMVTVTVNVVQVTDDPMVNGLKGQVFLFEGFHAAWFASIAAAKRLQWNWMLHVFDECENGARPTYITKHAFTFLSDEGVEHQVEVGVKDVDTYYPGCPEGEEGDNSQCLGDGSLYLKINEQTYTEPGQYSLSSGGGGGGGAQGEIMAFNAYGPCQLKRDPHVVEELLDEEAQRKAQEEGGEGRGQHRRRLLHEEERSVQFSGTNDYAALDVVESRLHVVEDKGLCKDWLADKRSTRDLYTAPGKWASVYIFMPTFTFQLDYRQEVERCHAHVIDAMVVKMPKPSSGGGAGAGGGEEQWSGIMGETQRLQHDSVTGQPILRDRHLVLRSDDDADYQVSGPWATDFKARLPTTTSTAAATGSDGRPSSFASKVVHEE